MWVINEVFVGGNDNENSERQQEQLKTTLGPQADGDEWSEISRNGQELKEKYIYPRMTQMDTDGCPQADGDVMNGE